MYHIRQIFFTFNFEDKESEVIKLINQLTKIPYINKHVLAKKVTNQDYIYLEKDYDYTLILYFCNQSDIDKYILHPLHQSFVTDVYNLLKMRVYDYITLGEHLNNS